MKEESSDASTLKGFVYGLNYFIKRGYGMMELQVLCCVKMMCLEQPGLPPRAAEVAQTLRLPVCMVKTSLETLEDNGLVYCEIPKYGDLDKSTYRLAAKGGTMMKKILQS